MSAQLPLSFGPRARRSDPSTSHRAAADAERFSGTHAGRILVAVCDHDVLTTHQLAEVTGLSVVQCDRRGHELERDGWVFFIDAGLSSRCWHPTQKARTWRAELRLP